MSKRITFNEQQGEAVQKVLRWLRRWSRASAADRRLGKVQQVFRLFGYAGTGKTTLAKYIADSVTNGEKGITPGQVLFAAFTGKASSRLLIKGCKPSSTIHSLIYRPVIDEHSGRIIGKTLNRESPAKTASLVVIDEVSMVNEEMARDLLSYGVPILVLGDPGQLPPIEGEGWFINAEPDYMLTEIARQAKDSPILMLATRARLGQTIEYGRYDENVLVLPSDRHIADKYLIEVDQILCGTNNTRRALNQRFRQLSGKSERDPLYPVKGEKIVCLKNNHDRGLINGTQWKSSEPELGKLRVLVNWKEYRSGKEPARWVDSDWPSLKFKARSLDLIDPQGNPLVVRDIQVSAHLFNSALQEPPWRDQANAEQFDFGHCLSVHRAQGSEWDSGLIINESHCFREHSSKHLYTAVTRVATRLILRL